MLRVAIDLSFIRSKVNGGTESFTRNLLDGFAELQAPNICYILLTTIDNYDSFRHYRQYPNMDVIRCNAHSVDQYQAILWQNVKLGKIIKDVRADLCYIPVYRMPFFGIGKIPFLITIHDIQQYHYPQYFSKLRVAWMETSWRWDSIRADRIITDTEWVKKDIEKVYRVRGSRVEVIPAPIVIDTEESDLTDEEVLSNYHTEKGKYYYTVSSLLPHKNIITLIKVMKKLREKESPAIFKLIVSGVGGGVKEKLISVIEEYGLSKDIILTEFISNAERNCLYRNCRAFLLPSTFEGFGMTAAEALAFHVPVLCGHHTSLPEATGGLATYLDDVTDPDEWIEKLEGKLETADSSEVEKLLQCFDKKTVAAMYDQEFRRMSGKNR